MTLATQAVLPFLIEDPTADRHGLELSAAAGLPSQSLHPILARLEALEWVDSAWENIDPQRAGRPERRCYHINERGMAFGRVALPEACARRSRTIGRLCPVGGTS